MQNRFFVLIVGGIGALLIWGCGSSSSNDDEFESAIPTSTTTTTTTTAQHVPALSSSKSSTFKWLLGIGIAIGVIWLANQGGGSTPSKPSRPSESKPSIGTNHLLSAAEIRYCLAESIRIDAARNVLDKQSSSHIAQFNHYVGDYNSRCSKYRYRDGALERARRDINPYRGQIRAEGRNRFL